MEIIQGSPLPELRVLAAHAAEWELKGYDLLVWMSRCTFPSSNLRYDRAEKVSSEADSACVRRIVGTEDDALVIGSVLNALK